MKRREMSTETRAYLRELRASKRGVSAAQRSRDEADAAAERWNAAHPVGIAVDVTRDDGSILRTRTRSVAWRVCDHTSVLVEGITGGYLLERVRPVGEGQP